LKLSDLSAFLFPMRTHLVNQIQQQRCDFLVVIAGKDVEIRRLRAELQSRDVRMETDSVTKAQSVRPLPFVGDASEKTSGPLDWQGELAQMLKEEEEKPDGISI
jgi:hypothetical protein